MPRTPLFAAVRDRTYGTQLKKLYRNIDMYTNEVLPKHLLVATRVTALSVLRDARSLAPKRTGRMANALRIERMQRKRRRGQYRVGYRVVLKAETMGLTPRNFYPQWIELGAPGHRSWGGALSPLEPVRFMRTALHRNRNLLAALATMHTRRSLTKIHVSSRSVT